MKKSLKVGILTFHEVFNPGAFLQAYSTQTLLKKMGHRPEIINYNPPAHRYHPISHAWRMKHYLPLRFRSWSDSYLRDRAFAKRRRSHMILSPLRKHREEIAEKHYDAVVVGADIVWNFEMSKLGRDPAYFGEGIKADRLIAFAPSCGPYKGEGEIPNYVRRGLENFHRISVRDNKTGQLVKQASGRDSLRICDPAFHIFDQVETAPPVNERGKYILVYLLPGWTSSELVNQILALKQKTGLPIHAVIYRHSWADKNIMNCGPFDWLEKIRLARYFITNTFHGTIFGAFSRADFAIEQNEPIRSKSKELLEEAGLLSREVRDGVSLEEVLERRLDFDKLSQYTQAEASRAEKFLEEALQGA